MIFILTKHLQKLLKILLVKPVSSLDTKSSWYSEEVQTCAVGLSHKLSTQCAAGGHTSISSRSEIRCCGGHKLVYFDVSTDVGFGSPNTALHCW